MIFKELIQKLNNQYINDTSKENPPLKEYYKDLNKQESRLSKDKMVDLKDPKSERFYFGNDIGVEATGKMPNAKTSGWTGLYTRKQMDEAGEKVSQEDVSAADISSTAIERIRYNPKNGDLYITFKNGNGTQYLYPNVPSDVVRKFMNASSKGHFFNERIKRYSVSPKAAKKIAKKNNYK